MVKTKVGGSKLRRKAEKRKATRDAPVTDNASMPGGVLPETGRAPPKHVRRKLVRRVRFLERVSAAGAAGSAAPPGVRKRRRRPRALPSLAALSDALAGVERQARPRQYKAWAFHICCRVGIKRQEPSCPREERVVRDDLAEDCAAGEQVKVSEVRPRRGLGAGGAKARKRITGEETARLQQVLSHKQFQADPIAAVTHHLRATLPPAQPPPKPAVDAVRQMNQRLRRRREKAASAKTAPKERPGEQAQMAIDC